ncbi:hypothetical protein G3I01_05725 [Gramella sp. MT6]|uniref:DUF5689 domain-containing protein n=1 Tax=Gramella sp. MT6 TaxID=2705471 RepID=UPI001C5E2069|nr:DUF5689 domain-containing protein [Gramella sp. MT6]QYA25028.1 hypothetical protein G3I01_05725 [Gramella sp. MT6]
MKNRSLLMIVIVLLLCSCVKTDDYDSPDISIPDITITGDLTSIMAVKGNFDPVTGQIYTFQNSETWFEGYVISSDAGGNFYKEIILQDKPEDPTSGIQILLDDNSLYETFDIGRKVLVKLDGLSLGFNNGVLQLGIQNLGDVVAIPNALIQDHVFRTEVKKDIKPLSVNIDDFSEELKNLYIKITNVQFDPNLVRTDNLYSFASNTVDQYDGKRQLISCETGSTSILSTSTFSDFKSLLLPTGSGSIEGILTRDFYDEHYVVVINTPDALKMYEERCDPIYLDCGNNLIGGTEILLEENFDGVTSNTTLNSRGWTNINVSGGEKKFAPTLSAGNRVLRISAYNTIESPLEAWLVTPEINLDETNMEVLIFDMLSSYDNGLFMKVFITSDFTGDPRTTHWTELDANIPLGPSGANSNIFRESKIDISCLEGEVWIGFRYLGAAPDKTTTYDLDNIRVIGE